MEGEIAGPWKAPNMVAISEQAFCFINMSRSGRAYLQFISLKKAVEKLSMSMGGGSWRSDILPFPNNSGGAPFVAAGYESAWAPGLHGSKHAK